MLYAGRRNPSRLLVLVFAAWVLSPFVAAILAWAKLERWSAPVSATLYVTTLVVALASVCVYGAVALGHLRVKARPNIHDDRNAFSELVQPLGVHTGSIVPRVGSCISFLSARTSLESHVDAGRHRFSCPFFS
jgi:hypothetical protein